MPHGVFSSDLPPTPAVSASGTKGATGVSASSDTGTGLNVQVGNGQGTSDGIGIAATAQNGPAGQFMSGGTAVEASGRTAVRATGAFDGGIGVSATGGLGGIGVEADTDTGAGTAVQAITSSGTAGLFRCRIGLNFPKTAGSGTALEARAEGTGTAAYVHIDNADSTAAALDAVTQGTGPAAYVHSGLVTPLGSDASPSPALVVAGPEFELIEPPPGIDIGVPGPAASFSGSVDVTGDFTATAKSFVIDHPLDPANKYLVHASVESSEQANVYSGNIVLDDNGEAVVNLPAWVEAVNEDFRYQLTCVGRPAPVYVAGEVAANQFRIAGGTAGMKVSWQLTGIRKDAWAMAHPLAVERDKPEREKGHFRHPELFGSDRQHSIARLYTPG